MAYGTAIGMAVWMATVARNKVGDVHQVTSLLELQDEKTERETSGVKIVLSKSGLDDSDIGYQLPEAKGFWNPKKVRKHREPREAKKETETTEPADEPPVKKHVNADRKKQLLESVVAPPVESAEEKPAPKKRNNQRRRFEKKPNIEEKPSESKAAEPEKVEATTERAEEKPAESKSKSKSRQKKRPKSKS